MQYMMLLYADPSAEPSPGTPEFDAYMAGFYALTAKMKADGAFLGGDGLQGVETATSLRVRGGRAEVMDGPFAETREHLGGYYLMEVPDLDAALAYARMVPVAGIGTVELRPVMIYG